jgi:hypothetical protein
MPFSFPEDLNLSLLIFSSIFDKASLHSMYIGHAESALIKTKSTAANQNISCSITGHGPLIL